MNADKQLGFAHELYLGGQVHVLEGNYFEAQPPQQLLQSRLVEQATLGGLGPRGVDAPGGWPGRRTQRLHQPLLHLPQQPGVLKRTHRRALRQQQLFSKHYFVVAQPIKIMEA